MLGMSRSARRKSQLVAEEHQMFRKMRRITRSSSFDYGNCQIQNLRGESMRVSAQLPGMSSDMRPLYHEAHTRGSRQKRMSDRVRAEREAFRPVSIVGLRGGAGITAVAAILLFVLCFSLWSHTRVTGAQKTVNELYTRAARSEEGLESAKRDYDGSLASIDVAYNARNLGLVSSKSMEAIMLYAPQEARFSPADTEPVLPRDTLATILGY